MTYEEILLIAKIYNSGLPLDGEKAMNLIISALEKQIPKKTIRIKNYHCPSCKLNLFKFQDKTRSLIYFCPRCGQAIDWSGNDENQT